ncbi:SoxR reducing system RseC family protein [bacterium]|nr:SoxR reducing system RseC family protein [bacterium]
MASREQGTIIECNEHTAVVAVVPKTCDGCSCSIKDKKPVLITASALPGIKKGDRVIIETSTSGLLKAGLILGILPTIGFFMGIGATKLCIPHPAEYMYFIGGMAGVGCVLMGVKLFSSGKSAQPSIAAIIDK